MNLLLFRALLQSSDHNSEQLLVFNTYLFTFYLSASAIRGSEPAPIFCKMGIGTMS